MSAPAEMAAMDDLRALIAEPHRELINISAELVTAKWLLSEYREDHTGMVTRATMRKIRDQNDAARECALRLRKAADKLPGLLDRLAAVERDAEKARELLTHARCPQKCTNGTTPYGEQCQWCDERAQLFAAIAARKGEG